MSTFSGTSINARFPARYRDALPELRFRVIDVTEEEPSDILVTTEIGDGLVAAITWGRVAVTSDAINSWGVSIDEAMATATDNIAALPVKTDTREAHGATVLITSGNPWVSSLIVAESRKAETEDGFLVAVPHSSVMVTTPVVGEATLAGLEILMNMGEALSGIDDSGISPFVWWWYDDNYWRVTDRTEDGSIAFRHHTNVNAFHLAGAIEHLANPCAECGRE